MSFYLCRSWTGTRLVQPAGRNRRGPLRYWHGIALRLPFRRVLIVTFGRGSAA